MEHFGGRVDIMIDEARSMGWVESIQRVPNAPQRDQIYPEVLRNYRQKDQPVSPVEAAGVRVSPSQDGVGGLSSGRSWKMEGVNL